MESNKSADQLNTEILNTIEQLNEIAIFLSNLETVSHKSQAKIQFVGGILGPLKEIKEEKRLEKIMNTPLYDNLTFYKMAFDIGEKANELVEKQLQIQKLYGVNEPQYYGNVKLIIEAINIYMIAWYEYSPDAALAGIRIGDEKNVALFPSVVSWAKAAFSKLDLPEEYSNYKNTNSNSNQNTGCFSVIILLVVSSLSVIIYLIS